MSRALEELKLQLNPNYSSNRSDYRNTLPSPLSTREIANFTEIKKNTNPTKRFSQYITNAATDNSYELDLEKKVLKSIHFKPSEIDYNFSTNQLKIQSCSQVTTILLNNKISLSYLTNPISNSENFYLKKSIANSKFEFEDWSSFTCNRLNSSFLNQFINELNALLGYGTIYSANLANEKRKNLLMVVTIFSLLLMILSLIILIGYQDEKIKYKALIIFSAWIFVFSTIFSLILVFYIFRQKNDIYKYSLYFNAYSNYLKVEGFIDKWNKDFFLEKGIIVNISPVLTYICFCLDPYTQIIIEPHEFSTEQINKEYMILQSKENI